MSLIEEALKAGDGILRLKPTWVPRSFMMPGGRLRLHPSDLYALGAHRGGINERWFSSTTNASNGPGTPGDEGLSYVAFDGKQFLLKEAVNSFGDHLLGQHVMKEYGGWNVLCKFFDNLGPIPHHMHQSEKQASLVGQHGKPESYYFPPQYNMHENNFPYTFMGLEPGTRPEDVRACLERWNEGDNGILYLSKAYRLKPGTGWQIDPGVLHAPGSLVTYEPQVNSDVFAMFQSMVEGRPIGWELLVKDVPPQYHRDLDYLIGLLNWEANVDEKFGSHNLTFPRPVTDEPAMKDAGYREVWVSYGTGYYTAKELTVYPGRSVTIRDGAAYGLILTQGFGEIGVHPVETPTLIRYGQMTRDELFVSADAAGRGVVVANHSQSEPLVLLKHFGPGNPDAESLRTRR